MVRTHNRKEIVMRNAMTVMLMLGLTIIVADKAVAGNQAAAGKSIP